MPAATHLPAHQGEHRQAGVASSSGSAQDFAALAMSLLFGLAWLLPNHYAPWPAFHSDAVAGLAVLAASFGALALGGSRIRWSKASLVVALAALVPQAQYAIGLIDFFGDALMATVYLLGLALAIQAGAALQYRKAAALDALLVACLLAGLASVVFAGLQWLRLNELGIFVVDIERNGRPYANFGQPNQLATFLMLAAVSAFALHHREKLSSAALGASLAALIVGIAMTQSRAASLEMAGLLLIAVALRRRAQLRVGLGALLTTGAGYVAATTSFPVLSEWLYLSGDRGAGAAVSSNQRLGIWHQMFEALLREPWQGYGWNQVSVAQAQVAADLPPLRILTEHSHNLVIDLLVWNGVPLGLLFVLAGAWWLWRHLRACRDGAMAWPLIAVVVLVLHALVEFPHDYAYLLFPVGVLAGSAEAQSPVWRFVTARRGAVAWIPVVGLALLGWITTEYFAIEGNHREMRFENARIGTAEVSMAVPPVVLLTQLREFLYVARHQASAGMSSQDLARLRRVAERYGYPPVLLRYALAAALNDQPREAAEAMRRLCSLHEADRCKEGLDAWSGLAASTYPQIRSVPMPPRP